MSMATPFIVLIWVPSDMIDINTKKAPQGYWLIGVSNAMYMQ
jgi:hypothetical protein